MAKTPAFPFILEELFSSRSAAQFRVKPMFGAHAIYKGDKIHFIVRQKGDATRRDDGLWVVIPEAHVEEITKRFPALRKIEIFEGMSKKATPTWWNLPESAESFEADAIELAEMVIRGDERLGKIPKAKPLKKAKPRVRKPR